MRRVLPGHSDAAVQLNAFLGSVHGDAAAVGLRDGRGDRGVVVSASTGAGGVSGGGRGGIDLDPQIRQPVLDGLIGPDRPAELLALLDVAQGGIETPLRDAQLLGREQSRTRL